jgi:hypothetical protein
MQEVPDILVLNSILTWLIPWEDVSILIHSESLKSYMCTYCYLYLQMIVDQPEQPSVDQQQPGTSQQSASMFVAVADHNTPEEEGWREWELWVLATRLIIMVSGQEVWAFNLGCISCKTSFEVVIGHTEMVLRIQPSFVWYPGHFVVINTIKRKSKLYRYFSYTSRIVGLYSP